MPSQLPEPGDRRRSRPGACRDRGGGNAPTTTEADAVLRDRGVLVLRDILCSAGGLLPRYFEWVQDTQAFFWAEREIAAELERIMEGAFAGALATAERERVDLPRRCDDGRREAWPRRPP